MRKNIFSIICVLTVLISMTMVSEAAVAVRMDGTSTAGDLISAVERAKKRAVFKVLSHDTRPENDPQSIFFQLVNSYGRYIEDYRLEKQVTKGDTVQVILQVQVDRDSLMNDFHRRVFAKQSSEAYEDMTAYLILGAKGTADPAKAESLLHMDFQTSFSRQGFQMEASEYVRNNLHKIRELDFNEFHGRIVSAVKTGLVDELMPCVIIGQFQETSVYPSPAGDGYIAKGSLRLLLWDVVADRETEGFFKEYTMLGQTQEEARELLLRKAAADGAEDNARKMLAYWRNSKGRQ